MFQFLKRWSYLATLQLLMRDPLIAFVAIAGLLFLANAIAGKGTKPEIVISEAIYATQMAYERELKGGELTPAERNAAIKKYIAEELLLKEAYKMGLNNDHKIRTQLIRKIEYLLTRDLPEPDEQTLRDYYSVHKGEFKAPDTLDLELIEFTATQTIPDNYIGILNKSAGRTVATSTVPTSTGATSKAPQTYLKLDQLFIARRFGQDIVTALSAAPPNRWQGPISTTTGTYFVRLLGTHPATFEEFHTVKRYVQDAWIRKEQNRIIAAYIQRLQQQYLIRIEGEPADDQAN
jgi:hypothetical protein